MFEALTAGTPRRPTEARLVFADAPRQDGAPAGFRGDVGETASTSSGGLLVGAGRRADVKLGALRAAGSRLVRALERAGAGGVRIDGLLDVPAAFGTPAEVAQAFAEGMAMGNWRFGGFDGSAAVRTAPRGTLTIAAAVPGGTGGRSRARSRGGAGGPVEALAAGLAAGLRLGDAVNEARRIAATPPNVCDPAWVASESRRLARRHGLRCRVIGYAEAVRLGMGGIASVGRGSSSKPCLVVLEHAPRRVAAAARGRRLALVGKTITYDTGGYSLKINNGMRGMKYDKCGGAAVLGAMVAVAEARLPVNVVALLPCAENMVSGESYRPDDIIRMHNGVAVEVTNTDAEGRLVLADALSYACRTLRPTEIIDIATLTGGVVVALGAFSAGYFCNDDGLRERIESAAARSGEKVWRLPLWPEHREFMRSQHADIVNSNPRREAAPGQGAAFLSYFVDPAIPWAHLDIAGVNAIESANDLIAAGPTGWGVRLLYELAAAQAR